MTATEILLDRLALWVTRAQSSLAARPLRKHAEVEAPCFALGAPWVENRGRISIGSGFHISSRPVQTHLVVHRGATLRIGHDVHVSHGCGIACHSLIQIGDRTQIGAFTMVLDSDYHVPGDPTAKAVPLPIEIGREVCIGSQVTILRGSRIGDHAIIEPGTVVSGDIPAGARVAGVPARLVLDPQQGEKDGSVDTRVTRTAMRTFRLETPPSLNDGPEQINAWNSLGALSLLVSIEEEFGVSLSEQDVQSVRTLGDLVRLLSPAKRSAA